MFVCQVLVNNMAKKTLQINTLELKPLNSVLNVLMGIEMKLKQLFILQPLGMMLDDLGLDHIDHIFGNIGRMIADPFKKAGNE